MVLFLHPLIVKNPDNIKIVSFEKDLHFWHNCKEYFMCLFSTFTPRTWKIPDNVNLMTNSTVSESVSYISIDSYIDEVAAYKPRQ